MRIDLTTIDSLVKTYKKYGFSDSEIKEALTATRYPYKRVKEIEAQFDYYFSNMIRLGYKEEEIRALAINYPNAILFRFKMGGLHEKYVKFIENLKEESKKEEKPHFKCEKVREILENLGVNKKRIDVAFKHNHKIIFMDPKTIKDNIKFYLDCGMTKKKLAFCVSKNFST